MYFLELLQGSWYKVWGVSSTSLVFLAVPLVLLLWSLLVFQGYRPQCHCGFFFLFSFFLNKPGCPWRICLSRWDNWFRIPMPLFIITRSWFFKEYGFDAWWLAWCQASLLGILAVWCSDAICRVLTRPINRRSNTTSQASLGGPGRTVPSNHSDRVRRCHWTGRCALDTMLGAYKGI